MQGSATVGIKSRTHVLLVALKRSTSELSSHQKKIYHIADHVGVSIAGLTSDGRMLRSVGSTFTLHVMSCDHLLQNLRGSGNSSSLSYVAASLCVQNV